MGQSLKAVVQLFLIIAVCASIFAWAVADRPDEIVWAFRIGSPTLALVLLWLLIRQARQKDSVPDVLASIAPSYLERDGICFAPIFATKDGICWVHLLVQNRYGNPGEIRIVLLPGHKSFGMRRLPLPSIDETILCEGGGVKVRRVPTPIPQDLAGNTVTYEVSARTTYPSGRGRLLRHREGLRAGGIGGGAVRTGCALALLPLGIFYISRPATIGVSLPLQALDHLPPDLQPEEEILWQSELPTGGFPVEIPSGGSHGHSA